MRQTKERNIGALLITHLVNFARTSADSVVFLDDGRVVEAGGAAVLSKPKHDRVKEFLANVAAAS